MTESGNETTPAKRRLLSLQDAARYLSISRRSLDRLRAEGYIPDVEIGARRLVDVQDLDDLVERQKSF